MPEDVPPNAVLLACKTAQATRIIELQLRTDGRTHLPKRVRLVRIRKMHFISKEVLKMSAPVVEQAIEMAASGGHIATSELAPLDGAG